LANKQNFCSREDLREIAGMSTNVAVFNVFSVHVVSLIVALLALVAVFAYIPFVSEYAFWFMVAAYIMLAAHR
jgi:tetrahydromethanopterin S-methyltransferase subunit B